MPYLLMKIRKLLAKTNLPKCGGDMNFMINLALYDRYKVLHEEKVLHMKKGTEFPFPSKEIGKILKTYLDDQEIKYIRLNDCMGALMNGIFEYIRRNPNSLPGAFLQRICDVGFDFAASWYFHNCAEYEDKAIVKNGDVFPKLEV